MKNRSIFYSIVYSKVLSTCQQQNGGVLRCTDLRKFDSYHSIGHCQNNIMYSVVILFETHSKGKKCSKVLSS
ncbi:unnamed protein product [Plutella xylostella]|uniref:(diamondback moth) hypothetical protein n=1 Tax=Plutella xylostella TaxID=51655 RepID=A0A8S4FNZ5_PLUXY|nr:unnamed protein product [Plutella xylostella]